MSTIRVFVNSKALDVPQGSAAIDCVRAWKSGEADDVASGARAITDSRGLEVDMTVPAKAGAIFRTVSKRSPTT